MEARQTDRLIESIDRLTDAVTEVAVKIKRLTNQGILPPDKPQTHPTPVSYTHLTLPTILLV